MSKKNVLHNFEKIDTEEKAYWLGFLYADGNVSKSEDKIELSLAEVDLKHIQKFKEFMGIENKICYREQQKAYRISFRSQSCKQDLIDKGCVPAKSLILKFPNEEQVPKELIRHFIRGYFDGDGWFTNTEKCFQTGIIGTKEFIEGTFKYLEENNIKTTCKIFNKGNVFKYNLNSYYDVKKFLNWIYKDSNIYLDRKYEHYLDFINNGSKYHKTPQE